MNTSDKTSHYPANIARMVPEPESSQLFDAIGKLPDQLRPLIAAPRTAAYIRGLAKNYSIPEDQIKYISYAILVVTVGEKTVANLPAILSTRLKIPNDKAQKMATEIERELFAPVALILNQYRTQRKKIDPNSMSSRAQGGGASNILDLKNQNQPPTPNPPPIPPAR